MLKLWVCCAVLHGSDRAGGGAPRLGRGRGGEGRAPGQLGWRQCSVSIQVPHRQHCA